MTKSQNGILLFGPKSHTKRENIKIGNADWEDKSSPSPYFCQWLTSQIHIHICYWFIWEMMRLKPSEIFSSDMFPVFTPAIANMQCPFSCEQQHSFYRWGNFMSICRRHRLALCHCQVTHERVHLFLLKSNDGSFCNMSSCAWGFIQASWLNFPRSRRTIAPCKLFKFHLTLAKPAVVVLPSLQTEQRTLKTSKSASMVFPSFFMLHTK